jgi:2-succinyl-5-enolpyruvyl-6-hydroxy-3-cyclohexene-1-carboxylate synthase
VNNGGGGIFRFLPGSSETDELEDYFATGHAIDAEYIACQFNVAYQKCDNADDLKVVLPLFFAQNKCSILEIKTPVGNNASVLKAYFKAIQKL